MDEVLQAYKCERHSKKEQHWEKLRNLRKHKMSGMTSVPGFKEPEGEWPQRRLVRNSQRRLQQCCKEFACIAWLLGRPGYFSAGERADSVCMSAEPSL